MPDNLAQNVGSGAISPATCPSPINGEAADAPSIDVPLQNLLDRANYNLTVASDRINAFSTAMGITPDNSDPDQLAEAAGKMRDTIATVDATANHLTASRPLKVYGSTAGAGDSPGIEARANAVSGTKPAVLAFGSTLAPAVQGIGSSSIGGGSGTGTRSGGYFTSDKNNTALFAEGVEAGVGGEFRGGVTAGDGLRAQGRASGSNAAVLEKPAGSGTGHCLHLKVPGGESYDALLSDGKIKFSANGESSRYTDGAANNLQAANVCKAWCCVRPGVGFGTSPTSYYGVPFLDTTQSGGYRTRLTFTTPFAHADYAVIITPLGYLSTHWTPSLVNLWEGYLEFDAKPVDPVAAGTPMYLANAIAYSVVAFGYQ